MTDNTARIALLAPLVVSGLALSGCMSSPTYGTDKTANEQLVGDITGAFSFAPPKKSSIDYKPRPELVKPAPGQKEALPAPQDSITQTADGEWPESPEQRRLRLRAEATANQDNPSYEPKIVEDTQSDPVSAADQRASIADHAPPQNSSVSGASAIARRAQINQKLIESRQGDPNNRKYLSEPPTEYRVASDTAPQNDIGEDEYKKERRLKREAAKKGGSSGLFDWLPWSK